MVNILEPSSWDDILSGPKIFIFVFLKKSTIPSTNGFSGPTIINFILLESENSLILIKSEISISIFSASSDVPAFPGKQ